MPMMNASRVAEADSTGSLRGRLRFLENPAFAWTVLGILVLLVWGPRLLRSFWVDEAGTYWMAYKGPLVAIQRTWHWPGQSILYSLLESFFAVRSGPLREIVLRIPSLIGIAIAAYFQY